MQNPEEYTVLHIGPDPHDEPVLPTPPVEQIAPKPKAISDGRKNMPQFRAITMTVFFVIALMIGVMAINSTKTNSKIVKNESTLNALIDEVGGLKQEKFMMSQQLSSQEIVLQTIEDDFSNMQGMIKSTPEVDESIQTLLSQIEQGNLSKQVFLASDEDSTFDVLIVGTNGAHTDTILVASVNPRKQKVTVFSIPRDLYINGRRINEYFTYYGVDQLQRMVGIVTGLKMDHYMQVDLKGFVEIVDIINGIDISVEKAIYDGLYPDDRGGYSPYSIEAGNHHLDGEAALKYARSRKSTSDFDRSSRQQMTLMAVRQKVLQLDLVMDMKSLTKLFQAMMVHTKTDIDIFDALGYYHDYRDFDVETGFVLTSSNYLYSLINESGAYILLPKAGNFEEIKQVISQLVN